MPARDKGIARVSPPVKITHDQGSGADVDHLADQVIERYVGNEHPFVVPVRGPGRFETHADRGPPARVVVKKDLVVSIPRLALAVDQERRERRRGPLAVEFAAAISGWTEKAGRAVIK